MRIVLLLLFISMGTSILNQDYLINPILFQNNRSLGGEGTVTFNPDWAPFFHGVASGDPMADRVIIWTRVTPPDMSGEPIEVSWKVASDIGLTDVVQEGVITTDAERDYTVKVDVTGLEAGTTYYYGFQALDKASLTGKTKTTPEGDQADHLKFAVVSCSNFQAGYFNAYRRIADRTDLDAVIHLGDYIYEYADGIYGDEDLFEDRPLEPATEIVSLEEYRTRYSTYRLDTSLARVHQQFPFIAVWDDHESANDSYVDGAENHDPATEGDWETRKAVAKQAYFEWMPIRENDENQVYRTISYGDLMDLIMLDTRLEGREEQILDVNDPDLYATDRTILGESQKAWLKDQLLQSDARWKVLGQQVIFAELNVGWASLQDPSASYDELESIFLDIWDGYPAEREELIAFLDDNEIDNTVFLTGDFHCSFGFDVSEDPVEVVFQDIPGVGLLPFYAPGGDYDPLTGVGSKAVEFATPSISSANFDENVGALPALGFQLQINADIMVDVLNLGNPNSHMKYVDLIQHGYFILDLKADSVQANWYFTPIDAISQDQNFAAAWYTLDGENYLQEAPEESGPKAVQDDPAPLDPPVVVGVSEELVQPGISVLGVYPNPFSDLNTLHYSLAEELEVQIRLLDGQGRVLRLLVDEQLPAGVYTLRTESGSLANGTYFYEIRIGAFTKLIQIVKVE
jgi:alkaline phosphatase D